MIHTIKNSKLGNLRFTCSNGYNVSIGIGPTHYCDNHRWGGTEAMFEVGSKDTATTTMEVAIMDDNHNFVVLPYDVVGYVSVSHLPGIIEAVQCKDWSRVCLLCGTDDAHLVDVILP